MDCPYCTTGDIRVIDKREVDEETTRRRRECNSCTKRFTTYETIDSIDLTVVKRDGSKQEFDREKMLSGVRRACEKRPVEEADIEDIVADIERHLRRRQSTEVKSTDIGSMVLTRLKRLDEVAYIRFASVYQSFDDVQAFQEEAAALAKN